MASPNTLGALTDAFRVARYDTHFKSHPPYFPPKGHENEGIALDKHASLATNCWIYPLVALYESGENFHIPFEGRINEDGFVLRASPAASPLVPIPERQVEFLYDSDHPKKLEFSQKVDEEGRALMVRLFLSPFRLSLGALKMLCSAPFQKRSRASIPSLWDWTRSDVATPLTSSDGWNYLERRTTLAVDKHTTRVWVGCDPFHVARRRSDLYVKARLAYLDIFEPTKTKAKKESQKRELLFAIDDAIATNQGVPDKYRRALDETRIKNESIKARKQESDARANFTELIIALVDTLKSPYFTFLQQASLSPENFDENTDNYSEALAEHIATLTHVMRHFDECAEGLALLNKWAADANERESHFLNNFVIPPRSLRIHVFRTVRWMSKGMVGLLKDLFPKLLAHANASAENAAKYLHNLGVFETAEQALSALGKENLKLEEMTSAVRLPKGKKQAIEFTAFKKKALDKMEAFFDQGEVAPGVTKVETLRSAAFSFIDAVNVWLAFRAYSDAKGEPAIRKAAASGIAASTFLIVGFAEFAVKLLKGGKEAPIAFRVFAAARAASGIVYGILDILDAEEAQKQGDNNRALALLAAATAEMCAAGILIYQFAVGSAVLMTPLAIAGLVAAAAYTTATWLKDDPLEIFLENCEYGRAPYSNSGYKPPWATGAVPKWKGEYTNQRNMLTLLLTRFSISWRATASNPATGVNINCGFRTPDMRITIHFTATFKNNKDQTDTYIFEHNTLPIDSTAPLVQKAEKPYINLPGIKDLIVTAKLEIRRRGHTEQLSAFLIKDGVERTSGDVRLVAE